MSEGNKKSGGSYRAQSALTIARNKRLKGERHAKRMREQALKVSLREDLHLGVPRGAARAARRAHLQRQQPGGAPQPLGGRVQALVAQVELALQAVGQAAREPVHAAA